MSKSSGFFQHPPEFEPLLPERKKDELVDQARGVVASSIALTHSCHPSTLASLAGLLREMNSYYSNRIEGQSTHPRDIVRALNSDYSSDTATAKLQRLAVAHIEAERSLEAVKAPHPLSSEFLKRAHLELYARLDVAERVDASGALISPGVFRDRRVTVGRHTPPEATSLVDFARRFDSVYAMDRSPEEQLVSIAAAHHRASWIHPFQDGNGRAVRLQTTARFIRKAPGCGRQREAWRVSAKNIIDISPWLMNRELATSTVEARCPTEV
jgi:Fic family protein